jgi:hypothetical protein
MATIESIRAVLEANGCDPLPSDLFNPRIIVHALLCHILEKKCHVSAADYRIIANLDNFIIIHQMMNCIVIVEEMYEGIIDDFLNSRAMMEINYRKMTSFIREKINAFDNLQKCAIKINRGDAVISENMANVIDLLINGQLPSASALISAVAEIDELIDNEKIIASLCELSPSQILAKFFMADETVGTIIADSLRDSIAMTRENANETNYNTIQELLTMKQVNENLREINMRLVGDIRKLQSQIEEFSIVTSAKNEQFINPSRASPSPIVQYRMGAPSASIVT